MNKLDSFIVSAKVKGIQTREKIKDSLKFKRPGDSQIVVALVLIAVAIGLCLAFRTQIASIMSQLFSTIKGSIDELTQEFKVESGSLE